VHRPGIEFAISLSQIRRPNHYVTEPRVLHREKTLRVSQNLLKYGNVLIFSWPGQCELFWMKVDGSRRVRVCAAMISHGAHNISVETTHSSAHVCWLPAFDGGSALHHVLWFVVVKPPCTTATKLAS